MSASSDCWFIGSRPLKGSSRITRSGSWAMAESSCTFWAMPLLSERICRFIASPRPWDSSSALARRRPSAGATPLSAARKLITAIGVIRR